MGPFAGTTRSALDRAGNDVLALAHYNINRLAEAAEKAHQEERLGLEAEIRDILGRQVFRELELSLGKRMSVNVNLKTQDDLKPTMDFWRSLPPDQRLALDKALDLYEQVQKGMVIPTKALSGGTITP